MILAESIEMYLDKKQFIENINEAFQIAPGCPTVEGVSYEVYTKGTGEDSFSIREWVIVHFVGGGRSVKQVTGNSNIANFKVIGGMLVGGYYTEVYTYQKQIDDGYTKVDL